MSSPSTSPSTGTSTPSPLNYVLSFLIVGLCWGFTTPFIRKAAITYQTPTNRSITDPNRSWISRQVANIFFSIIGLLRSPRYAIPLLLNLTGSIWFFLLVGQAGEPLPWFTVCLKIAVIKTLWSRTLPYSPHHKLSGFSFHRPWRVVCRWEAHYPGHLARHGPGLCGYSNVRCF